MKGIFFLHRQQSSKLTLFSISLAQHNLSDHLLDLSCTEVSSNIFTSFEPAKLLYNTNCVNRNVAQESLVFELFEKYYSLRRMNINYSPAPATKFCSAPVHDIFSRGRERAF